MGSWTLVLFAITGRLPCEVHQALVKDKDIILGLPKIRFVNRRCFEPDARREGGSSFLSRSIERDGLALVLKNPVNWQGSTLSG